MTKALNVTAYMVRDEDEHLVPERDHALFVGYRHDDEGLNEARKIAKDRSSKGGPQLVVDVVDGEEISALHRSEGGQEAH